MIYRIGQILGWPWRMLRDLFRMFPNYFRIFGWSAIVIYAVPRVENYWAMHFREIPGVPVGTIVFLFAAAAFLATLSGSVYLLGSLLRQIAGTERTIVVNNSGESASGRRTLAKAKSPTDGSFIPANDEALWAQEKFELLKKHGVLIGTDLESLSVEDLAREIGLDEILKRRGKTEE